MDRDALRMVTIFRRIPDAAPIPVETVPTENALGRLIILCVESPGDYFAASDGRIVGGASLFVGADSDECSAPPCSAY
jgi:hypothetical protein